MNPNKVFVLFLFSFIYTTNILSQDSISFKFSVNHIALSVKDVNRSAEFYQSVLMLPEITNRSKIEGVRWFLLGDGRELHLISVVKEGIRINKAIHLGLSTVHFDRFVKRISSLNIPYSDWPGKAQAINIRADGIKQIFFQDPDGYWIEVNSEHMLTGLKTDTLRKHTGISPAVPASIKK